MQMPTVWAKKLIKLDDIKNLRFKKGNRDRMVRQFIGEKRARRSKGMQARTGISYTMHTLQRSLF